MKVKTLLTAATLALAGWFAFASTLQSPALAGDQALPGSQVAQNEQHEQEHQEQQHKEQRGHAPKVLKDQWYQGQRGHWYHENDRWQWRGAPPGDQWYQGQRGHWYQESNGWQFGSEGLVCDNQCRNCRPGGYIPANGEGMVSRDDPNVCWSCDSEGHHCHWARRPF